MLHFDVTSWNIWPSVLLCHGHVKTYSVLHLYFRYVFQTATHCPVTQRRLFGNCTHCDLCIEIRVPVQTCRVSDRILFMYRFRQHRIEPQEHARPWFGPLFCELQPETMVCFFQYTCHIRSLTLKQGLQPFLSKGHSRYRWLFRGPHM